MKQAVKLHCGHEFHRFCIMQMIANKRTLCPLCGQPIQRRYASAGPLLPGEWTGNAEMIVGVVRGVLRSLINASGLRDGHQRVRNAGEASESDSASDEPGEVSN